jgi:hypothetical protein
MTEFRKHSSTLFYFHSHKHFTYVTIEFISSLVFKFQAILSHFKFILLISLKTESTFTLTRIEKQKNK